MHPVTAITARQIRDSAPIPAGCRLLVATSAGPDSTALLYLLAELAADLKTELVAAYVDHGLRPAESSSERQLIRFHAERLGIPFRLGAVDVPAFARQHRTSTEEAARILRYRFLEETADAVDAQFIALGHTADDQAEELLLRLLRGSGRQGLAGMRARRGRYIRPLLEVRKRQLLDYLERHTIAFHEDSSNRSTLYLRNRIRHLLLPHLAAHYNPRISQTLVQTAEVLGEEERLLEELTSDIWERLATPGRDELQLDTTLFRNQPVALQRRLLERACWQLGCRPSFRGIEQIRRLAAGGGRGECLHLAGGLRVRLEPGCLLFHHPLGRRPQRGNLESDAGPGRFRREIPGPGRYHFTEMGKELLLSLENAVPGRNEKVGGDGERLDADRLVFPLELRSIRPGDRFWPLGAPGRKKVGDFFTDHKVPRRQRRDIPVLTSNGAIAAVVGCRIDHGFRVTPETRRVLVVRWRDRREEEDQPRIE